MRIGLDIGGHSIKAGLVSRGTVKRFVNVPSGSNRKEFLESIVHAIKAVSVPKMEGIGIGCPGPADYKKGIILDTPNIPLSNFNLKKYLWNKFHLKMAFSNDAVAFTLGEAVSGAGKGKDLVLGITLGTGLGGGIVLNGKPFLGRGNAGHFSHLILRNEYSKDHFFKYYSFEVLCSERGLLARTPGFDSAKSMAESAKGGNRKALAAFCSFGRDLGLGLGSLIGIFDPDIIVVGGGISLEWDLFEKDMHKSIRETTHFSAKVVRQKNKMSAIIGASSIL